MNEERLQSYLTLTQQLINCTIEEEFSATLDKNQDLLDAEYIEFLNQYATLLAQQGEEETARTLANLAAGLAGASGRTEREPDLQGYLDFLQTVLKAEIRSKGDPKVVYPILQRNLDKLNLTFAELLQGWARNIFANNSLEKTQGIAGVIQNLCIDIQEFPLGNRSHNLEIAIASYEVVLEVYTREAFPAEHATTLNNLANAYWNRIRGERAENLEQAIEFYRQALEVCTREAFPAEHATTLNNLAAAYNKRIRGERAENLEQAIEFYRQALEFLTCEAFPAEHAMTLNNLAIAYSTRIRGDRAENQEKAIEFYRQALEVRTREAFPVQWATTLYNLANVYSERIQGDRAENLEIAITRYRSVLQIFTEESFPYQWGSTTYNLGFALNERFDLLGEKEDLEQAIDAFEQVMKFYEKHPDEKFYLARTRSALGHALFQQGNHTRAIEILERARLEWQDLKDIANLAATLFDLGRLYHLQGFLEQARLYYKDSSRLFRRSGDKTKESAIMVALGNLSMQTGRISDAENYLTQAKQYYEEENNVVRLQEIKKLLDFIPKDYAGFTKI